VYKLLIFCQGDVNKFTMYSILYLGTYITGANVTASEVKYRDQLSPGQNIVD